MGATADEADDLGEDAHRELAARRRDLQREFDLKVRDLKAQHQRRLDRLEQDRADWEADRRVQAKELADLKETTRRRGENAQQKVDLGAAERKELAALREDAKGKQSALHEAAAERRRLEAELAAAKAGGRPAQAPARWAAAVLVVAVVAWVAAGWQRPLGAALLAAGLAVAFLLMAWVGWSRRPRMPRG